MITSQRMLSMLPATALNPPGRAFLEDLLAQSVGWHVAFEQIGGEWFMVESGNDGSATLTPIEVFNLEEASLF